MKMKLLMRILPAGVALLIGLAPFVASAADARDIRVGEGRIWPQFLGPARDNRSPETGLAQKWPEGGPELLSTVTGLGIGFSNIALVDGIVYTMGNRGEREFVLAFRLADGSKAWEFDNAPAYHNGYGDGPRGTPTVDGEFVYALGGGGDLACLERSTGRPVWRKNLVREFDSGIPTWGFAESVLIDGDRLICTLGTSTTTMAALDKRDGRVLWKGAAPQKDAKGYASPIAIEAGGVRQYVQFTQKGVVGLRAADGEFLWRDDSSANGTANCSAPIFADGMVFTASGYSKGASMVRLSAQGNKVAAKMVYHDNTFAVHHGGLVLDAGYVYALNDSGVLICLELATGKISQKNRSVGKGSLTYADGMLFLRSEQGPVALARANPTAYEELGRFSPKARSNSPAWTYPVVADGKLFLRDQDILQVYDVKKSAE
jgi:outer membrane protein assembly factor BamB